MKSRKKESTLWRTPQAQRSRGESRNAFTKDGTGEVWANGLPQNAEREDGSAVSNAQSAGVVSNTNRCGNSKQDTATSVFQNQSKTRLQIDILSGGFPCQPHSVAGKRKGSGDNVTFAGVQAHHWAISTKLLRR